MIIMPFYTDVYITFIINIVYMYIRYMCINNRGSVLTMGSICSIVSAKQFHVLSQLLLAHPGSPVPCSAFHRWQHFHPSRSISSEMTSLFCRCSIIVLNVLDIQLSHAKVTCHCLPLWQIPCNPCNVSISYLTCG